jgi:hypothetical protein
MGKEQMSNSYNEGRYSSDLRRNLYNWLLSNSGERTSTKSINHLYFSHKLLIL